MANVTPITPSEAKANRVNVVPSAVFESFNLLITENLDEGTSRVNQKDVLDHIRSKLDNGMSAQQIMDKGWLNIEDVYRAAGWKVVYDKPDYTETRDAVFVFTAKRS
jgi:hypothetical protein